MSGCRRASSKRITGRTALAEAGFPPALIPPAASRSCPPPATFPPYSPTPWPPRKAIDHGIRLAEHAATPIEVPPELALVAPPSLAILTFAYRPAGPPRGRDSDLAQQRIGRAICAFGEAILLTTRVHGDVVHRMCTINPAATETDVADVLDLVVLHGRALSGRE